MITIGINSVYHESSAAIVVDGEVVAAVAEERFNRVKHGKPAQVDTAHHLPLQAIRFCLEQANARAADIDAIGYSFDPAERARQFRVDPLSMPGDWGSEQGERRFRDSLSQVGAAVDAALGPGAAQRLRWLPHHLTHAASAFWPSGFGDSAILVVDGIAEDASTWLGHARWRGPLKTLKDIHYPHSIGFLWEKLSKFLGFSEYDACKVMGLAAYGDAARFREPFARLARLHDDGFAVDASLAQFRLDRFDGIESLLGPARARFEPIDQRHHDVAAALQAFTEDAVLALARQLHAMTSSRHLCLAGGVALNCVANQRVKEQGPFDKVFVPTAPHDAGTAVGAALLLQPDEARRAQPDQAYSGPGFTDREIVDAIEHAGLKARRAQHVARDTAALLAAGAVVGWFQGRMEFGPRALGNRSLLGDPRNPRLRDLLNRKVKHREDFRPFAPSVLAEHAHDWFELGYHSESMGFMLFTCPVRSARKSTIPAVLHCNGTGRVQVVERRANPAYHELLVQFHALSGVPVLLNTSFNDSEPIVCSPSDALSTFMRTSIDAIVLGEYIVDRQI